MFHLPPPYKLVSICAHALAKLYLDMANDLPVELPTRFALPREPS